MLCPILGDFTASSFSSNFTALEETTTTVYNFEFRLVNDVEAEEDEGFIVYFNFDESGASSEDYNRLDIGTGALLITISDDDTCECRFITYAFHLSSTFPSACVTVTVLCSIVTNTASTLGIECIASAEVEAAMTCSFDGGPAEPCIYLSNKT